MKNDMKMNNNVAAINNQGASRTKMDNETLDNARSLLLDMADALRDVLVRGESMSAACRNKGLTYTNVRRVFLSSAFENCRMAEDPLKLESIAQLEPNGYEKIYMFVFEVDDVSEVAMPSDYKNTVMTVFKAKLTERELKIVQMLYGIGDYEGQALSYQDIAEVEGVVDERIRQIERKILSKLKSCVKHNSTTKELLIKGMTQIEAEKVAAEAAEKAHEEAVANWLKEEISKSKEVAKAEAPVYGLSLSTTSITDLHLPRAVEEGLIKAGKQSFMDVLQTSDDEILAIPNVGRKTLQEVNAICDSELEELRSRQKEALRQLDPDSFMAEEPEDDCFTTGETTAYSIDLKEYTVDELELSTRAYNALRKAKIDTLEDLMALKEDDLLKMRNLGEKCCEEIIEKREKFISYYGIQ